MKRSPLLLVAALIGVVVSASAQRASQRRQSRGSVTISQQSQRGSPANRVATSRSQRSVNSARRSAPARVSSSTRRARSSQVGYIGHNGATNRPRAAGRAARSISVGARVGLGIGIGLGIDPGRRYYRNHSYGHWVTRPERVLVPGYWSVERHAAVYGWVYDPCGHRVWGVLEPAHNHRVWVPARYETRSRQVWVCH